MYTFRGSSCMDGGLEDPWARLVLLMGRSQPSPDTICKTRPLSPSPFPSPFVHCPLNLSEGSSSGTRPSTKWVVCSIHRRLWC